MESKPTHEQAQLHLQVYDLRREPRLRQARDWFQQKYRAETVEEAMALAGPGTENGTNFGMVIGYWEQACALLNYGLLHEDLFFETSGEFFFVWEQLKGLAPQFREQFKDPTMLANLEKVAKRFEEWKEKRAPGHIAAMREWMRQEQEQKKSAAAALQGDTQKARKTVDLVKFRADAGCILAAWQQKYALISTRSLTLSNQNRGFVKSV
jgi:hypothetical protein